MADTQKGHLAQLSNINIKQVLNRQNYENQGLTLSKTNLVSHTLFDWMTDPSLETKNKVSKKDRQMENATLRTSVAAQFVDKKLNQ